MGTYPSTTRSYPGEEHTTTGGPGRYFIYWGSLQELPHEASVFDTNAQPEDEISFIYSAHYTIEHAWAGHR